MFRNFNLLSSNRLKIAAASLLLVSVSACDLAKNISEGQSRTPIFLEEVLLVGKLPPEGDVLYSEHSVGWGQASIDQANAYMQRLGLPKSKEDTSCGAEVVTNSDKPDGNYATCKTLLHFETGDLMSTIVWKIENKDSWHLISFNLDPYKGEDGANSD